MEILDYLKEVSYGATIFRAKVRGVGVKIRDHHVEIFKER